MMRKEGIISRFFYNPITRLAMLRFRGSEQVYKLNVPAELQGLDDLLMTRPGDKVCADIDTNDRLDSWFNETYVIDLN